MKKLFAALLSVMMVVSMATVASAAENTTTLTTTVPDATYTLNIPADQEIPFGATETDIGNVTVTNSSGFAEGKNLKVTISYSDFTSEDVSTTIPLSLYLDHGSKNGGLSATIASGSTITFFGNVDSTVDKCANETVYQYDETTPTYMESLLVKTNSVDWGKALGGEYTATITFTAEVVVE